MSLPMAIVDFIPVILFLMAAMTLLHDLYHLMSKGAFALLSAGLIIISVAGFFKATWKLLYALNICDFAALNSAFFPKGDVQNIRKAHQVGLLVMSIITWKHTRWAALFRIQFLSAAVLRRLFVRRKCYQSFLTVLLWTTASIMVCGTSL